MNSLSMRSAARCRQLVPMMPRGGAAKTDEPFLHVGFLLLTKGPADIVYVMITESVIGWTTCANLAGHLAELAVVPSSLMRRIMGKGPLLLGGSGVARANGGELPWESMVAIGAAPTSVLTRVPNLTRLVARVRVWVCGVGRGGPR